MFGDFQTRFRLIVTIAIVAALAYLVVWSTVQPNVLGDPVTFILNQAWLLSWGTLIIVAAVAVLLTALICRRRLPDLPLLVFAACLSLLSLLSGPAVRAHWSNGTASSYRAFALELLLLTALLFAVQMAGKLLLARFAPKDQQTQTDFKKVSAGNALQAMVLAGVASFVIILLCATTTWAEIGPARLKVYGSERGQIIFAALAAGFLSTLAAHQSFRSVKSLFCWLPLPLLGFFAYLVLAKYGSPPSEPLSVHPLGNFLPIDFAGPGVLGAMLGLLLSRKLHRERDEEET